MKVRVVKRDNIYTVEQWCGWGWLGWWRLYQVTQSFDQACVYFNQLKQLGQSSSPKTLLIHYF